MVEGNLFPIQLTCVGFIDGFLLHGPGTIYFISVLLNAKCCGYAGDTKMSKV